MLVWELDLIDNTNKSGAMEFVVPAADASSFFPIEVRCAGQTASSWDALLAPAGV